MNKKIIIPKELENYVYFSSPGVLEARGKLPNRLIKLFEETKSKFIKLNQGKTTKQS